MYRRVFIFELSGPTLAFLQERLDRLPTFKRLFEQGASAALEGPLQPVLATSFATLYTGMNPGKTGLFDFFSFPTGGYRRFPYSLRLLAPTTLFEHLAASGKRVGMLNTPLLHPLPQLDGFLVSGDDSLGDDFARPVELARTLMARGYSVPFGHSYAPGRERAFLEGCLAVLAMRRDAARALFREQPWDFGMLTLHLYGELLHAFWKFYDRRHPEYRPLAEAFGTTDPFLEVLVEIDGLLAEMIEAAGSGALILVMGAWGHGLEHTTVHLNRLLEREGHLRFSRGLASQIKHGLFRLGLTVDRAEQLAHRLDLWKRFHYAVPRGQRASLTGATFLSYDDVDWSRTRAVALGYLGQIYLNVRGERPAGVVAPAGARAGTRAAGCGSAGAARSTHRRAGGRAGLDPRGGLSRRQGARGARPDRAVARGVYRQQQDRRRPPDHRAEPRQPLQRSLHRELSSDGRRWLTPGPDRGAARGHRADRARGAGRPGPARLRRPAAAGARLIRRRAGAGGAAAARLSIEPEVGDAAPRELAPERPPGCPTGRAPVFGVADHPERRGRSARVTQPKASR